MPISKRFDQYPPRIDWVNNASQRLKKHPARGMPRGGGRIPSGMGNRNSKGARETQWAQDMIFYPRFNFRLRTILLRSKSN